MKFSYFRRKLKDVKAEDYLSFLKLGVALLLTPCYKAKHRGKTHWVVCETPKEARDNGYCFFYHMKKTHPEQRCFYAIDKKSPDASRVEGFGDVVKYGSIRHWVLYLTAEYNISSQKGGKPSTSVCAFLELMHWIDSRFVFLQHGVIINKVRWAFADITQLRYFITSAKPEHDYIVKNFGYKPDQIVLTGMPRFDNLHEMNIDKKLVLIMPTWRSQFVLKSEGHNSSSDFETSEYKRKWEEFLNSSGLEKLREKYGLHIMFFPHRNAQRFLKSFEIKNQHIEIGNWENHEIQDVMKKAAVMVTDYSSVFFDMVYMKKPVVFYQFDYDEFRKTGYEEGYFNYRDNPFAKSYPDSEGVIEELDRILANDCKVSDGFLQAHREYFPYYDANNSERIYQLLIRNREGS